MNRIRTMMLASAALGLIGPAARAQFGGGAPNPGGIGRYQMHISADNRIFVIDSVTGQCWSKQLTGSWENLGSPAAAKAAPANPAPAPGAAEAPKPGGESVNGQAVTTGNPQFTLTWDTKTDLDLHVIEPGGKEVYWEQRNGGKGGSMDVDDVDGFGPENIFWPEGPPGTYKWFVQYYGGFGARNVPTRWKVRIRQNGRESVVEGTLEQLGQRSRTASVEFAPEKPAPAAR